MHLLCSLSLLLSSLLHCLGPRIRVAHFLQCLCLSPPINIRHHVLAQVRPVLRLRRLDQLLPEQPGTLAELPLHLRAHVNGAASAILHLHLLLLLRIGDHAGVGRGAVHLLHLDLLVRLLLLLEMLLLLLVSGGKVAHLGFHLGAEGGLVLGGVHLLLLGEASMLLLLLLLEAVLLLLLLCLLLEVLLLLDMDDLLRA
jgi:hypothetical protein